MDTLNYPIWYNYNIIVKTGSYTIYDSDENLIYSGYAKSLTDNEYVVINLRNIFMNYLSPYAVLDNLGDGEVGTNNTQFTTFYIRDASITTTTDYRYTINTWLDWSYSKEKMNSILSTGAAFISHPINFHWSKQQTIPFTWFCNKDVSSSNSITYNYTNIDGTEGETPITIYTEGQVINTLTMTPETYSSFEIRNNGLTLLSWSSENERCGYGALYYLNASSGWDSFLLEHNIEEQKTLDRQEWSSGAEYISQTPDKQYITKSITTKYSTNTGWLSDTASQKLYDNLLTSSVIYFEKFGDERQFIPVYFSSTDWTKKEWRNGRKLISYDLSFTECNHKINS